MNRFMPPLSAIAFLLIGCGSFRPVDLVDTIRADPSYQRACVGECLVELGALFDGSLPSIGFPGEYGHDLCCRLCVHDAGAHWDDAEQVCTLPAPKPAPPEAPAP